jgi:pimeloyl-ACP methyl ester carboxylesterase
MDTTTPQDVTTAAEDRHGSVTSADGTEIGWYRSGAGDPAVLLHGTSADSASWALAGPHLSRHLTLWSVDRRGRGRSGAGEPYDFDREVEDLAAVVGTLDEPPHVIAHSFGAMVALAAAAGGLRVRSLVLYEPPFTVADHLDMAGVADECERVLADGDREQVLRTFYRAVGDEAAVDMLEAAPPIFARFLANAHTIPREVRAAADFSRIDASPVATRTQLILGSESPTYSSHSIATLHAAIPHSEVAMFEGQAHLGHALRPDAFSDIVLEFIGDVD